MMRQLAVLGDLWCDKIDQSTERVGGEVRILSVERKAGDQYGERNEGAESEQRAEAQRCRATCSLGFGENRPGNRKHAQHGVNHRARRAMFQLTRLPDFLAKEFAESPPVFGQT